MLTNKRKTQHVLRQTWNRYLIPQNALLVLLHAFLGLVRMVLLLDLLMANCVAYGRRCCGARNAEILSVRRHGQRGVTHGIHWRRLCQLTE